MAITVTDTFQRVAANLGANWTNLVHGFAANNNAAGTSDLTTDFNLVEYSATPFTNCQSSTIVIGSLGAGVNSNLGAAVRMQQGSSGAGFYSYYTALIIVTGVGTHLLIDKIVNATVGSAGTVTNLFTEAATTTPAPGDIITLTIIGNTLTATYNNAAQVYQATDASSPLTGGAPGMHQGMDTATIASFSAFGMGVPTGATASLVCDGDSIVSGFGLVTPWEASLSLNGTWGVDNFGVPSRQLVTCTTQAPVNIDTLYSHGLQHNVCFIWAGVNDLFAGGLTAAQVYADLQTYVAARHAVGWKVVVSPMLSNVNVDAKVQTFNALLAANSSFVDAVVTLPATLTGLGAYANATYFQADGIHPNQTSATTIIAPAVSAAVNSLPIGGSSGSGLNVVGSGAGFATQIKSPRTVIIGTNLGTRII